MALSETIAGFPRDPGVYLFKDATGRVLYVGKAKDLRARVRQYISGTDERFMVPFLVGATVDIEVVRTVSEKEAIILENTLIKKHRPRYNTKLVDDANFLHLRIDPRQEWPDFQLVRKVTDTKARHFGPFASASRARATLEFMNRNFPLRSCSDSELASRRRPCLLYQMKRCLAPCVGLVTRETYDEVIEEAIMFLEGRNKELIVRLQNRMKEKATSLEFEEAARLRDLVASIEATIQRQHVVDDALGDRDVWALHRENDRGMVALVPIRRGMMQEAIPLTLKSVSGEDGELMSSLLNTWYQEGAEIPPEIFVSVEPPDAEPLSEVLCERAGHAVKIAMPQRGSKRRLVELAIQNAGALFAQERARADRTTRGLEELAEVCRLPKYPKRIESFDNSNIQGTDPVAAMVVFTDGRPDRAEYRRYRVKTVEGADDFATMKEILGRRFARALEDGVFPDLLLIDGGKGQVNAVLAALGELGIKDQPVIGIAKPKTEKRRGERDAVDKIVVPGQKNDIVLRHNSPALQLVQAIRDETHRTAVGYHRKVRTRRNLTSEATTIPGVGPVRTKRLLTHFGSMAALRVASVEEIAAVKGIGPRVAKVVVDTLHAPEEPAES